jgi:hypothetical protein
MPIIPPYRLVNPIWTDRIYLMARLEKPIFESFIFNLDGELIHDFIVHACLMGDYLLKG